MADDGWWSIGQIARMIQGADDDVAAFLIAVNALKPDEVRGLAGALHLADVTDIRELSLRVTVVLRRLTPVEQVLLRKFSAAWTADRREATREYHASRRSSSRVI